MGMVSLARKRQMIRYLAEPELLSAARSTATSAFGPSPVLTAIRQLMPFLVQTTKTSETNRFSRFHSTDAAKVDILVQVKVLFIQPRL
jgi:hypothetical protein